MELGIRLHQRVDGLVPPSSMVWISGCARKYATDWRTPCAKLVVQTKSGTARLILLLSISAPVALSPSRLPSWSGMKRMIWSEEMCTSLGFTPRPADLDGDFVPGQRFVRGDVIRFADGLPAAMMPTKPLCKVGIVRHAPKARAVAVDDDGLAVEHSLHQRPRVLPAAHGEEESAYRRRSAMGAQWSREILRAR